MKKIYAFIETGVALIPLVLTISILTILIWGLNKGFDLTDEGYIMMGNSLPMHIQPTGLFQSMLHQLFGWLSPGILFYRWFRLVLVVSASLFLSVEFINYFNHILPEKLEIQHQILVFSSLLLGSCMSYSIFENNISYNALSLVIALVATGLIFRAFRLSTLKNTDLLIFGLITAIQFIVKFPTAFLLIGLVIFTFAIHIVNTSKKMMHFIKNAVLYLIISFVLTLLLITISYGDLQVYLKDLLSAIQLLKDHDPQLLKTLYLDSFNYAYEQSILHFQHRIKQLILLVILYSVLPISAFKKLLGCLLFCVALYVMRNYYYYIKDVELHKSGMIYLYRALDPYLPILLMSIAVNFITIFIHRYKIREIINMAFLFLLIGIPLLWSAGTGNELTLQCLQYLFAPVAIFAMFYILQKDKVLKAINLLLLVGTCFLMYAQIRSGYVDHPYRITSPLNHLPMHFSNANLHAIYTDSTTNNFVEKIDKNISQKTTFQKPIPCIDFCKIPGVIYAINGYTPRNAWFSRQGIDLNTYFYNSEKSRFQNCILFLPTNFNQQPDILQFLKKTNINIGQDFILLDSAEHYLFNYKPNPINEQVGIWVSKNKRK